MKGSILLSLFLALFLTNIDAHAQKSRGTTTGTLANESQQVDWLPYATITLPTVAAFTADGLPVVLYNPRLTAAYPLVFAKFLALRQEVVASIAEFERDRGKPIRRPYGGQNADTSLRNGMTLIPEEFVHETLIRQMNERTPKQMQKLLEPSDLTLLASIVLDCWALKAMSDRERVEVKSFLLRNVESSTPIKSGDPLHTFDKSTLNFLEGMNCN